MKKAITLLLALVMCLSLSACGQPEVGDEVYAAVQSACDEFIVKVETSDSSFALASICDVTSIHYKINDITTESKYSDYVVDITWYVDIADSSITMKALNEYWVGGLGVGGVLDELRLNGKGFTHTNQNYQDSVRVVINGGASYGGYDKYQDLTGGSSSNGSSSNGSSSSDKECYVCGKPAKHKYGAFYYCATHWAMVKTGTEAD